MSIKKLSNNKKRRLNALADRAMMLIGKGQHDIAINVCAVADEESKDFPDIMCARGLIACIQKDYATGSKWFVRACRASPSRAEFQVNYAGCLLMQKQEEKAVEPYQKALAKHPSLLEALCGYSEVLSATGEYKQSVQALKKAMKGNPRNVAMLLKKLAFLCSDFGDIDSAQPLLEKAHAAAATDATILFCIGVTLLKQGNFKAAQKRLREAIVLDPDYADVLDMLIHSGDYAEREADIIAIRDIYHRAGEEAEQRPVAAFVLGSEADKAGDHAQAFTFWEEANQLRRKSIAYHESEMEELHQTAIKSFSKVRFSESVNSESSTLAPVFIVGMPRCGSTLLEQALSRHPELRSAGEMNAMSHAIVGRKCKPRTSDIIKKMALLDSEGLVSVGKEYERRLAWEYGIKGRLIDKELNNYLYAGVIARALPQARIIHVIRDPMAVALSIFQQNFVSSLSYAFDLEEIGRQYARYQRLMKHWRDVLPANVMLEVHYEDLVSNPETELRRLLQGCNLDWHEDCLASHEATGIVTSASMFQVRKPMHQKSVNRWKHYEQQLAPFKQQLEL